MAERGALDAGAVEVRLGADFDDKGFAKFDRAVEQAEKRKKVEAALGGDFDPAAFDKYDKALDEAQAKAQRRDAYQAALGGDFDARAFNKMEREMVKARALAAVPIEAELTADFDGRPFAKFRRAASDSGLAVGDLTKKMQSANSGTTFFSRAISLIKWPAMIAGAGMAAAAIGALAGGVVALTSALGPLTGALAAMPVAASAFAQGMGVAKLATAGVGDALGGLDERLDRTSDEFKKLTPEAQRFVGLLDSFKPAVVDLQRVAQRGLFPGMTEGLRSAAKNLPVIRGLVRGTSEALGEMAAKFGKRLGSAEWGRDIDKIGRSNITILNRLGGAGMGFAEAMRHVMVAAGPLTRWMASVAKGWGESAAKAAEAGRETGKLQKFFESTRATMERLGSIIKNVAGAFWEIGKAAAPLGREILRDLDKLTAKWKDWTESAKGKNSMADYFKGIKAPLYAVFGLLGDVAKMFGRLASSGEGRKGFLQIVDAIRKDLLPVLEDVIASTTKAFGPALVRLATNFLRIIGQLAGSSGPLTMFVKLLGTVAGAVADLLESNPALKSMVVTFMGLAGVIKAMKFVAAISGIKTLIGAYRGLTGAATAAATTMGTPVGGGRVMTPGPIVPGPADAPKAAGRVRGFFSKLAPVAKVGGALLGFHVIGSLLTALSDPNYRGVSDKFGKFLSNVTLGALPSPRTISEKLRFSTEQALRGGDPNRAGWKKYWSSVGDGLDGQEKRIVEKLKRVRESAMRVFGKDVKLKASLDPREAEKGMTKFQAGMNRLRNNLDADMKGIVRTSRSNLRALAQLMDTNTRQGQREVTKNMKATLAAIKTNLERGKSTAGQAMRAIKTSFVTNSLASKETSQKNFGLARDAILGAVRSGVIGTDQGTKRIAQLFDAYLKHFGAQYEAEIKVPPGPPGLLGPITVKPRQARGGRLRRAVGGFIGGPGRAGYDDVEMAAPEDSAIINRHQLPVLDAHLRARGRGGINRLLSGGGSAAGGPMVPFVAGEGELLLYPDAARQADSALPGGLDALFSTITRKHYLAAGGRIGRLVASGPSSPLKSGVQAGLDLTRDAANKKLAKLIAQMAATAGGGSRKGPKGIGTYGGLAMANWVIEALRFAAGEGVAPAPTSGYRSHAYNVSQGRNYYSEHEGTQYPKGAVDFGGYTTGYAAKMSVVNATRGFKYPLLAPIGFEDDGHASGTGHARGGRLASGAWVRAANALRRAGFKGRSLATALAVGGAESGSYTDMTGDESLGGSYGPWQVHHPSHPEYDIRRLQNDWGYSAKAAWAISGGGRNWQPWTTYRTGAWRSYEDEAREALLGTRGKKTTPKKKRKILPDLRTKKGERKPEKVALIDLEDWGLIDPLEGLDYKALPRRQPGKRRVMAEGGWLPSFAGGGGLKRGKMPRRHAPLKTTKGRNQFKLAVDTTLGKVIGGYGYDAITTRIAGIERDYEYEEARYDTEVGVEDFVIPAEVDADGNVKSPPRLDMEALAAKAYSLQKLVGFQKDIIALIEKAKKIIRDTVKMLNAAIRKLERARKGAKPKDRKAYTDLITGYEGNKGELKGDLASFDDLLRFEKLDLMSLERESSGLWGGANAGLAEAVAAGAEGGTGGEGGGGEGGGSGEDVNAAARAMFEQFNANRMGLFGNFGANFYEKAPGLDPGTVAAGLRYFGALGGGAAPYAGGAGAGTPGTPGAPGPGGGSSTKNVSIVQHFAAPPASPHIWTEQTRHKVESIL